MASFKLLTVEPGRALVEVVFDAPVNGKVKDTWSLAAPTDDLHALDAAVLDEIERYVAETDEKAAVLTVVSAEVKAVEGKTARVLVAAEIKAASAVK